MFDVRSLLFLFINVFVEGSTINVTRTSGVGDIYEGTRCGLRSYSNFPTYGHCKCTTPYTTFYGATKIYSCSNIATISQVNRCDKAFIHLIEDISLPCYPSGGKTSFKVFVRNTKENTNIQFWDESFSQNIVNNNINLERDKVVLRGLGGLLLKLDFKCPNDRKKKCIIIKTLGYSQYPYQWTVPSTTTTLIPSDPTTKKSITTTTTTTATTTTTTAKPNPTITTVSTTIETIDITSTTSSNETLSRKQTNSDDDNSLPLIVGIAVTAFIIVLVITSVIIILCRKRRGRDSRERKKSAGATDNEYSAPQISTSGKNDRNENPLRIDIHSTENCQSLQINNDNYHSLDTPYKKDIYADLEKEQPVYKELDKDPGLYEDSQRTNELENNPDYNELENNPDYNELENDPEYDELENEAEYAEPEQEVEYKELEDYYVPNGSFDTTSAVPNAKPKVKPRPNIKPRPNLPLTTIQNNMRRMEEKPPTNEDYYYSCPISQDQGGVAELYAPVIKNK